MKKVKKIFMTVFALTATFALTGCGNTKELADAYKKMSVGEKENQVNGYILSIKLFGVYGDEKVNESVIVSNYKDTSFKVESDDYTYYVVGNKKYKSVNSTSKKNELNLGIEDNSHIEAYEETKDEIPFLDTDKYILPLKNAKADDKPLADKIGEFEYNTYTFSVKKEKAQKLLENTVLAKKKLPANVPAKVWIDQDGYVYKIEYDIAAGYKKSSLLTLTVYYNGVNNASELNVNLPGV